MSEAKALVMNKEDNVATLLQNTPANTSVSLLYQGEFLGSVETLEEVDMYHKVSLKAIDEQETISKYGEIIGLTTQKIKVGEHVHTHNVRSLKV